jgi:hypothetical protein
MGRDPRVFGVVDRHRRGRVFVAKAWQELTALDEALVPDAIAKMEKTDRVISESRT